MAHEFGAPEADVRATFGRELHKQLVPEISDSLIAALERPGLDKIVMASCFVTFLPARTA